MRASARANSRRELTACQRVVGIRSRSDRRFSATRSWPAAGGESREGRADARALTAGDPGEGGDRDVLPVKGDYLALAREACEQTRVGEAAVQERRHAPGGGVGGGVQNQEVESERITRQSEHTAELAGAHDADRHVRGGVRGSGLPSTAAVWRSRNASSAVAIAECLLARMAAAQSAALAAPAEPIEKVATGTPARICTIDSSESSPPRDFDCTGTPRTGSVVFAAAMPGRWAAPPAPAIKTSSPRARLPAAYSNSRSGVRCAETTRTSYGIESWSNCSAAARIVSQSDDEPMMMPTSGFTAAL